VGISVGVVVAPDGTADIDPLLTKADKAMYRAKGRKASEPYAVEVVRLDSPPSLNGVPR
jgi:GGDEF domain-containing protein